MPAHEGSETPPARSWLRVIKDVSEIVTLLAALAAGAWAVWIFIYQDRIVPSRLPAQLTLHSGLMVLGKKDDFNVVKATIAVQNTSHLRVCIVGSTFNVRGYNVTTLTSPSMSKEDATLLQRGNDGDFAELPQWIERGKSEIVNSGRLFPPNDWWLDAGDEQSLEFVTYVPDRFDLVSLRSDLQLSKSIKEDRGKCYSDKISVQWVVESDGRVRTELKVAKGNVTEPYDFRLHKNLLDNDAPYHIFSSAWVPTGL